MPRPALRHIAHGGPIRRLPLPDALAALRLGMASVAVPQAVKSLDMTYYPTKDTGAKYVVHLRSLGPGGGAGDVRVI